MKYTVEQQAENRKAILAAGKKLFKERGFEGAGIDAIAKAAGLTSGALYSQFTSKQALFGAVLESELRKLDDWAIVKRDEAQPEWLKDWIYAYLNTRHRNNVAGGCVLPSLSVDVVRGGEAAQRVYEDVLLEVVRDLEDVVPGSAGLKSRERVWATLALLAGGIMLARAARSKGVATEILGSCRLMAASVEKLEAGGKLS